MFTGNITDLTNGILFICQHSLTWVATEKKKKRERTAEPEKQTINSYRTLDKLQGDITINVYKN